MLAQSSTVSGRIAAAFAICLSLCLAPLGMGPRESTQFQHGVLYVDDDAPSGGEGASWQSAFRYLQDALSYAANPQTAVMEIRVAQGTYKPDQGANQTPGNRNAVFTIPDGIALRGGYAGLMSNDPDKRDWHTFPTILTGDLLGNDGPAGEFQGYDDNSYRISILVGSDVLTTIEGLLIRGADGIPDGNSPTDSGGGLYCDTGRLNLSNCMFQANRSPWGGGAYLHGSDAEVRFCRFIQNEVNGPVNFGGGLYGGKVFDSEFLNNRARFAAGGAGASGGYFERCLFQNNSADSHGGAINGGGMMIDCEFIDNFSQEDGGAIYGFPTVINCTFRGNRADTGGAVRGIVTIIDSRFIGNVTAGYAGNAFWGGGTIINCTFIGNYSVFTDGGGTVGACTHTTGLQVCARAEFINCMFDSNLSWRGGAAWIEGNQTMSFTNCTFTNNTSVDDNGGAISTIRGPFVPSGTVTARNCVLWNNHPGEVVGLVDLVFCNVTNGWPGTGNISADPMFRNLLGPDGVAGTEDDDLRLAPGSPCIDAGDNSALPADEFDLDGEGNTSEPLPIDLDGAPRRVNDPATPNTGYPPQAQVIVDMGAFEFTDFPPLLGDVNQDGVVNVVDLLIVINSWGPGPNPSVFIPADLDHNSVVNHLDLLLVVQHWG